MSQPRQVPGIAQQRQGFSPGSLGAVQSPLAMGQPQQQPSPQAQLAEQMHELAMEIYKDLAVGHLLASESVDLRKLAQAAQTAARAYFEAMGVQF